MIRIATAALAALLVTAPTFAADAPKAPVTIKTPSADNKQGNVNFPHDKHAKVDCAKCHTDKANAKTVPAVHGVKGGDMKNTAHALCVECHKAEKAAVGCNKCHEKKA